MSEFRDQVRRRDMPLDKRLVIKELVPRHFLHRRRGRGL